MRILLLVFWALLAVPAFALDAKIEEVARGFKGPWSIGFLPSGDLLITEKRGKLWRLTPQGKRNEVKGLPRIRQIGQGGLFDVLPDRDFSKNKRLYLSYVKETPGNQAITVAMATLDGTELRNVSELFVMRTDSKGGRHFGGRLAQDSASDLFLTLGDRGDRPAAQDPTLQNGMIVRISPRGDVTEWTSGHRNPQGLAFDPSGQLWAHEHGARGGDEINLIERGKNYGWPVISYGRHYSGGKIGEGSSKPGLEQPVFFWDPSIAPSGFAIHSGKNWPEMWGKFIVGSLKFDMISVLEAGGKKELERISTPETQRVRDVREGPDGGIWFLSEGRGALYKMSPR